MLTLKSNCKGAYNDTSFARLAAKGETFELWAMGNGVFQATLVCGWVLIFNVKYDEFLCLRLSACWRILLTQLHPHLQQP